MKHSLFTINKTPLDKERFPDKKYINIPRKVTKKFIHSSNKFESVFSKISPQQKFCQGRHKSEKMKKNMSCINLGFDDQCVFTQNLPIKTDTHEFLHSKIQKTQRKQKVYSLNKKLNHKIDYQKLEKAVIQTDQKSFVLFAPDREKRSLVGFQKKLLTALHEKDSQKNYSYQSLNSSFKFFSYTQKVNLTQTAASNTPKQQKLNQPLRLTNLKMNRRRLASQQKQNQTLISPNETILFKVVSPQKGYPKGKKLIRRHFQRNSASELIDFKKLITIQNNLNQTQINNQNGRPIGKYHNKLDVNRKAKLNNVMVERLNKTKNDNYYLGCKIKVLPSQMKLKQLLNMKKPDEKGQHQAVLTPWQYITSQKQIFEQY